MNTSIISDYKINKVAIIDDLPDERDAIAEFVSDARMHPVIMTECEDDINTFISSIQSKADGAIFDHKLKPRKYANFDGAEAVAKLYDLKFPSILITTLSRSEISSEIRLFRRKIPVLLGNDADKDSILSGFKICINEFSADYIPSRTPYNTLVRIIEREGPMVYASIPAWNPNIKVRIPIELITQSIGNSDIKEGLRLFANVNIGAESDEQLFFEYFTIADKPTGKYGKLLRP